MNKNVFEKVIMKKGEMNVYDFGLIKLHAYKTNDFIDDEVFIVEKNGNAVIIESPCFFDNNRELEEYISERNLNVAGMLLAYHMPAETSFRKQGSTPPKMLTNTATVEEAGASSTTSPTRSEAYSTTQYTPSPTTSYLAKSPLVE